MYCFVFLFPKACRVITSAMKAPVATDLQTLARLMVALHSEAMDKLEVMQTEMLLHREAMEKNSAMQAKMLTALGDRYFHILRLTELMPVQPQPGLSTETAPENAA